MLDPASRASKVRWNWTDLLGQLMAIWDFFFRRNASGPKPVKPSSRSSMEEE